MKRISAKVRTLGTKYGPYLAIFGIILLFYHEILLVRGAWVVGDHAEQHFPWAYLFAQTLKQGALPFWTDLIHAGFPLAAEGQVGAFYLPNLFFYGLFPVEAGYAWNIIFHLLLSAFLMIRYLKTLNLDPWAIALGTLVYMFGSTLGGAYYNITSLKVLTWFPLVLMVMDRLIASERFRWRLAWGLGILYSLQILAGYLQFAVYAMLFSLFYFAFRWFETRPISWRSLVPLVLTIFTGGVLAVLLSMPQLWLTFDLAIRSNRAVMNEDFAYVGSYSLFAPICLLFPSLEGFFSSKLYLGVFPIFFMIAAFYFFKEEKKKSFYWLTLLAFLLAFGQFSPLYVAIVKLFHIYSFRTPVKFVFFAGFFLSVLAAIGCHRLLSAPRDPRVVRLTKAYLGLCAVAIAAVLGAYLVFRYFPQLLEEWGTVFLRKFVYAKAGHPYSWAHYVSKLQGFIVNGEVNLRFSNKAIYLPVLKMALSSLAVVFLLRKRFFRKAFLGVVFLLIIFDLNFTYSDIRGDYGSYPSVLTPNRTTEFLRKNLQGDRYFVYSQNPSEAPLPASLNMLFGLATVNAYSPLVLKDYYDFLGPMGGINDSVSYREVRDEYLLGHLDLLRMLRTRYILTDRDLSLSGLRQTFQEGRWRVYELPLPFPEFFFVKEHTVTEHGPLLLKELQDESFDPATRVYLEKQPVFLGKRDTSIKRDLVRILNRKPEECSLQVESSADQILVISQLHYPGWTAEVDGEEHALTRCNCILSAVPLTQGKHTLILRYRPFSRPA